VSYVNKNQDCRLDTAFISACANGNTKIFQSLINNPKVRPDVNAMIAALEKNQFLIFLLQLKDGRIDPSDRDNECLIIASKKGHLKIVELLLKYPKVDPTAQNHKAIRNASRKGYVDVIELLMKDPRVNYKNIGCGNTLKKTLRLLREAGKI
jgi:ankyrin repeat protein